MANRISRASPYKATARAIEKMVQKYRANADLSRRVGEEVGCGDLRTVPLADAVAAIIDYEEAAEAVAHFATAVNCYTDAERALDMRQTPGGVVPRRAARITPGTTVPLRKEAP